MLGCDLGKIIVVILIALFPVASSSASDADCNAQLDALIRLAADRMEAVFDDVSASTQALAEEFATLSKTLPAATSEERESWQAQYTAKDQTVIFQTWPGNLQSPPKFQAPQITFLTYNGTNFTAETFRQLELFEQMTPLFRAAYRSFDFSWSYLTTADNAMLIYPFLPLDKAVNNYPPTQQVYYSSADFENRRAGWTPPYLDLVGAGMMITVSYPAYDGDTLLGVVSHDITLDQLSKSVLSHLVLEEGSVAYIVTHKGLLISVTGESLIQELNEVNNKAGQAVLYYRTTDQLKQLGVDKAVSSARPWLNTMTDQVLSHAESVKEKAIINVKQDNRRALATTMVNTGWYLVMVISTDGQPAQK